ncbi:MAG: thioredoxin-like domain-containing protein, partial [Endomicrobiia bacterium]
VSNDQTREVFNDFVKKNNQYNWTFLYAGDAPEILKQYNIRVQPSYFLINPDRKIVMLPAPSPHENFEYFYKQFWIEMKREQQKK